MDDQEFEDFWFSLKRNIINFYKEINNEKIIEQWSKNLNYFKKYKLYTEIQNNILFYLESMLIDIYSYHPSLPLCYIFESNLKRWNKIIKKTNFSNNLSYHINTINLLRDKLNLYIKIRKKENFHNYFNHGINIDKILDDFFYDISITTNLIKCYNINKWLLKNNIIINKKYKPHKLARIIYTKLNTTTHTQN